MSRAADFREVRSGVITFISVVAITVLVLAAIARLFSSPSSDVAFTPSSPAESTVSTNAPPSGPKPLPVSSEVARQTVENALRQSQRPRDYTSDVSELADGLSSVTG